MAARASFSSDSRIVNISLPNSLRNCNSSVLLKDYLMDDLSSCSSNGFRSYPRRQCCTKVRYLIEIDLNKHVKLQSKQKKLLKSRSKPKSKPKSKSVLHKASAAVAKVFKQFHGSNYGSDSGVNNTGKVKCLLPRNLSRKLSKRGFWKRTVDRNDSFDELPIKQKANILPPESKHVTEIKTSTTSNSNSNSSASADSYFTATSGTSTTGDSSKISAAQNVVKQSDELDLKKMNAGNGENAVVTTSTDTIANGNAQKKLQGEEKDHFSPISVMDFPDDNENDNEEEVTSPFHGSYLYIQGSKRKLLIPKAQRIKSTLKPVRLEDRITLSESQTHAESRLHDPKEEDQTQKKATALLQLFKATMPSYDSPKPAWTESFLLEFFTERVTEGDNSNYAVLQDAKDWVVNGVTRDTFESGEYCKLAYVRDMEKGVKWLSYDSEGEKGEVVSEVEYEIFSSLVAEMSLDL